MEVLSSTELVILGLLKRQPAHGYELLRIARTRRMSEYIRLPPSGMYKALARLEEQGCVTAQVEREGNRPERQTYAITPKGEARLQQLLFNHLQAALDHFDPFNAALTFGDLAPRRALIKELRRRKEIITGTHEEAEQLQAALTSSPQTYFSRLRVMRWAEHLKAELSWLDTTIADLEGNRGEQVPPETEKAEVHRIAQLTRRRRGREALGGRVAERESTRRGSPPD